MLKLYELIICIVPSTNGADIGLFEPPEYAVYMEAMPTLESPTRVGIQ